MTPTSVSIRLLYAGLFTAMVLASAWQTASATTYAQETAAAINWLEQQQAVNGSWGSEEAIKGMLTAEVSLALRDNAHIKPSYYRGLTWLQNHAVRNVDSISRRTLALLVHGDDLSADVATLVGAQRGADGQLGGWGLSGAYESSPIDTSLALAALSGAAHAADVQAAIDYLKTTQLSSSNDGWALSTQAEADELTTAIVVLGLQPNVNLDGTLPTVITDALAGLSSSVSTASPPLLQALSALALLRSDSASTAGLTLLGNLLANHQLVSGSFDNDIYLSASVLRAIAAANGTDGAVLAQLVHFNDVDLRLLFTDQFDKNRFDGITRSELLAITTLDLSNSSITDLTGLGAATNLTSLDLTNTAVTSLSPLAGLANLTQVIHQSNTLTSSSDIDGDTLSDLFEVFIGTNPYLVDTDGDGLADNVEVNTYETNPLLVDTDDDGIDDNSEISTYLTDPLVSDTDGDGLSDGDEILVYSTDPLEVDTDSDTLSDGDEINVHETDPTVADTDGGGRNDGQEIALGRNPLVGGDDITPDLIPPTSLLLH